MCAPSSCFSAHTIASCKEQDASADLRAPVQMDGNDAVLCSANSTMPVSNIDNCPTGYTCATLPSTFLMAAVGNMSETFLNGACWCCPLRQTA